MENDGLNLLIEHGDKITGFIVLIALVFFYAKGLLPILKKQNIVIDDLADNIKSLEKTVDDLKKQSANTEKEFIKINSYIKLRMEMQNRRPTQSAFQTQKRKAGV